MTEANIVELAMMCSRRLDRPMSMYSWSENKSSLKTKGEKCGKMMVSKLHEPP